MFKTEFQKLKTFKFELKNSLLLFVLFLSLFYRLFNLGYSDFQGDEIKSLLLPKENQSVSDFLLSQRKGPMQFLITGSVSFLSNNYENRFVIRLPFALAGFLSVILVYLISKYLLKNEYAAIFTAFLFSFNGFFLSFSRFSQYQSLVILFGLLSIYLLYLSLNNEKYKYFGPVLSAISFSLSLLSHYDAIFFAPLIFFLVIEWFRKYADLKYLILSSFVFLTLSGSFYFPYLFSPYFSNVSEYLEARIDGTLGVQENMPAEHLFKVYNPKFVSTIYIILSLCLLLNFSSILSYWKTGVWFLASYFGMEYIVDISGTHIYVYLIPVIFLLGYGIQNVFDLIEKFKKYSFYIYPVLTMGFTIVGVFILYQSYITHLDATKEYPYEDEEILSYKIPKPNSNYLVPVFGFPHYRHWDEIKDYFSKYKEGIVFSTNEEAPITRFYMGSHKRSSKNADYYIRVIGAQSLTKDTDSTDVLRAIQNKEPEIVFFNNSKKVVEIFKLTE